MRGATVGKGPRPGMAPVDGLAAVPAAVPRQDLEELRTMGAEYWQKPVGRLAIGPYPDLTGIDREPHAETHGMPKQVRRINDSSRGVAG